MGKGACRLALGVTVLMLALAATNHGYIGLAQQASKMRWDIITLPSFTPLTIKAGGAAFASANDASYIKLTGSGTFGPGVADPVTGSGEWTTFDSGSKATGKGKYTVTGLVSFEPAPGAQRPEDIDQIADKADARSGLAVLRIAYTNEDGSAAGTGILVVSCHQPVGSPHEMFEGAIASKGFVMYFHPALAMPGIDANRTLFHTQTS